MTSCSSKKTFIVFAFIFRFLIHLELMFVCGMSFFSHVDLQLCSTACGEGCGCSSDCFGVFVTSQVAPCCFLCLSKFRAVCMALA